MIVARSECRLVVGELGNVLEKILIYLRKIFSMFCSSIVEALVGASLRTVSGADVSSMYFRQMSISTLHNGTILQRCLVLFDSLVVRLNICLYADCQM